MPALSDPTLHFSTVFMAFFAIMNPVANASLFLSMTDGLDSGLRRQVALRSIATAFAIILVITLAGPYIFQMFGISLPAFRIAGGILIGLIGYQMLQGSGSPSHTPAAEDAAGSQEAAIGIAISPLGIPILAGPGTIATAMNYSADGTALEIALTSVAFALMCIVTYAAFLTAPRMVSFLGQNAIKVITRLMGLILTVIGVQMLIAGINGAFPG